MFKLEIETGNAAFREDSITELARILKNTAERLIMGNTDGKLYDFNGNVVGSFELVED